MAQTLVEKLRIKPGQKIAVLNTPATHAGHPPGLPKEVKVFKSLRGSFDQIHLFVLSTVELDSIAPPAIKTLKPDGLLWVYFPKKTSAFQTDLSRDRGWKRIGQAGLHGVSLISLDETWSAFAFRRGSTTADRPARNVGGSNKKYVDRTRRIVRAPGDLARALRKNKTIAATFDSLAWTHKKEYVEWILAAKGDATRTRRVRETIDRLRKGLKNPSERT